MALNSPKLVILNLGVCRQSRQLLQNCVSAINKLSSFSCLVESVPCTINRAYSTVSCSAIKRGLLNVRNVSSVVHQNVSSSKFSSAITQTKSCSSFKPSFTSPCATASSTMHATTKPCLLSTLKLFSKTASSSRQLQQTRRMFHGNSKKSASAWTSHSMDQLRWTYPNLLASRIDVLSHAAEGCGVKVSKRHYPATVQKHVSALAVKRPSRKKTRVVEELDDHADKVVAYAVADELNLTQLKDALHKQGLYDLCELPVDVQDSLHVQAKYAVDEKKREIFFFRDGSAVFWSMPEVERKEVIKFLRKHDHKRYPTNLILQETEEMDIKVCKGTTGAVGDTLQLNEESDEGQAALEKYAFSNALAQSVKLAIWESMLDSLIEAMEPVVEDLRNYQKIRMSRREVLGHTGELFALRHLINLSSDLLDTPDFYWDRSTLETLYLAVYNHHDIARRLKVMNEKLSYCVELTELLSSNLNDAHHTRLEVMIIILILVEVVFEIVHYLERFLGV